MTAATLVATADDALAVDTSWQPRPGEVPASGNYAYIASAAGDYIGASRTYLYQGADTDFTSLVGGSRLGFRIEGFQGWFLDIELPDSAPEFTKGAVYTGLTRYPFNGPEGGISFYGEGRGCNEDHGWVAVDDLVTAGDVIQAFTIRFEQRCESTTAPPLHGQIHYDADAPIPPAPTPIKEVPSGLWEPESGAIPGAGNYFYMASDPGDWVGQGRTWLYGDSEIGFNPTPGAYLAMNVRGDDSAWWSLMLMGSDRSDAITAGYYPDLQRYPFHNPVLGGFDVSGSGRGCNNEVSWAAVDEIDRRANKVSDLTMRYEQHCEGGAPALHGGVHWETPPGSGAPGAPTGLVASPGAAGATLSWSAPADAGSSPITGYRVVVYDQGDAVRTVDLPPDTATTTLTDLASGGLYRFKVQAVNAHGAGLRSTVSQNVTPTDGVPTITGLAPTSGPRTGGTAASIAGRSFSHASQVTVGGTPVPFTVVSDARIDLTAPNLSTGSHDIRVTSPGGTSPVVEADRWTAQPLAPGPPVGVSGTPRPSEIDASWGPPASAGDEPTTGYIVSATPSGGDEPAATITAPAGATAAKLTGLPPETTYVVHVAAVSAVGVGAVGASGPVEVPPPATGPFASVTDLVTQQFVDFVGRGPTGSELEAAAAAIQSGTPTTSAYLAQISKRAEWAAFRAPLVRLYAAYFERLPDAGGLAYWAGKLQRGTRLSQASASFAASKEFNARYGPLSNRDFVLLVYRNVLERRADPAGLAYWTKKLDRGKARSSLLTLFSESAENVRKRQNMVDVVLLHLGLLRAMPGMSFVRAETARLAGGAPLSDLAGEILIGARYAARF